jgi:hypothetical protein
MHEEQEGYAEQFAFDEALEGTGVLRNSPEEFGPSYEELQLHLARERLEVHGMSLRPPAHRAAAAPPPRA